MQITSCPRCGCKLRFPTNLGTLLLTCPACRYRWEEQIQPVPILGITWDCSILEKDFPVRFVRAVTEKCDGGRSGNQIYDRAAKLTFERLEGGRKLDEGPHGERSGSPFGQYRTYEGGGSMVCIYDFKFYDRDNVFLCQHSGFRLESGNLNIKGESFRVLVTSIPQEAVKAVAVNRLNP